MRTPQFNVGPRQPNRADDVLSVQQLLNRHDVVGKFPRLMEDGIFGRKTAEAIYRYQMNVLKMNFPDEIVEVNGGTLKKLLETAPPKHSPLGPASPRPSSPGTDLPSGGNKEGNLTDAQYAAAAQRIGCEPAVIKAITVQECNGPAFDSQGRPVILFERWWFSSYTRHVWDKTNPNVTLAKHLRYPNGKINIKAEHSFTGGVYVCFDEAFRLDSHAALLSTSWGKFQIMGFNYKKAGYDSPEAMVAAMRRSVDDQLQAFTGFVLSDHVLTSAFQNKNWAALASHYNGGSYQSNDYDNSLRSRYEALTGKG